MLEERISYLYSVTENGHVWEEQITKIFKDGKFHSQASTDRQCIAPDGASGAKQEITKKIAKIIHTPEVVKAYKAKIAEADA